MSKQSLENIFVPMLSTVTCTLAVKIVARLSETTIDPITLGMIAWGTFLAVVILRSIRLNNQSSKLRMDLLFRMHYQVTFLHEIARDEEERMLYKASLLRKLNDLAEFKAKFGDDGFFSYYIGCLAFCANEKRANIAWPTFRDQLVEKFSKEILSGKIAHHTIDDHYKGKWGDLVHAAQKFVARKRVLCRKKSHAHTED